MSVTPIDRRELILARVEAILKGVDLGLGSGWRNRGNFSSLSSDNFPLGVVLDGDEEIVTPSRNKSNPEMPFALFVLLPEIHIAFDPTKTIENADIGPLMSLWRGKLIYAFVNDTALLSLLGDDGDIEYQRMQSDMRAGAPMLGAMKFDFAFTYLLDPDELKGT